MRDILYQDQNWRNININRYVRKRKSEFDRVDLATLPDETLTLKLQVGAMAASLVEFDPLRHNSKKRDKLNAAVLKELRRQLELLTLEYNRRVMMNPNRENMGRLELNKPKSPTVVKPKAQTIGLNTVNLHGNNNIG